MIAELGFDWSMDLVYCTTEDNHIKFFDHLARAEFSQVPTAPPGRTLGMFLGDICEIRARFYLVFQRLAFLFGGDEYVSCLCTVH